jgi:hypothetical protein
LQEATQPQSDQLPLEFHLKHFNAFVSHMNDKALQKFIQNMVMKRLLKKIVLLGHLENLLINPKKKKK